MSKKPHRRPRQSPALTAQSSESRNITVTSYYADGEVAHPVQLIDDEAWEAADLHSIVSDLRLARDLCALLYSDAELSDMTKGALTDSATLAYTRCFGNARSSRGNGRRAAVPKAVMDSLDPELKAAHQAIFRHRDEHVGHRIDPGSQQVKVFAMSRRADAPVDSVQVFLVRVSAIEPSQLSRLTAWLLERLEPLVTSRLDALRNRENQRLAKGQ